MAVAVLASVYVVGKTVLSKATSPAPAVAPVIRIPPPTSENIASPTPISKIASPSSQNSIADLLNQLQNNNSAPVTNTGWKVTGTGDVSVSPEFSADGKSLNVDFTANNFSKIVQIDYSLSYDADPQVVRLIKGSFIPLTQTTIRNIPFGTCSAAACTYDTNPRNFALKVLVKANGGLNVYLITLTITSISDQTLGP